MVPVGSSICCILTQVKPFAVMNSFRPDRLALPDYRPCTEDMRERRYLPLLLLMLLPAAGCVSVSTHQRPVETTAESPVPAPVQPAPQMQPKGEAQTPQQVGKSRMRPAIKSGPATPPAVLALLEEAEASRSGGQLDNAAATLERAIRIQPRNPLLWQQLASLRLEQHQPGLAEDLAKKSNVLAQGNRSVIQRNWGIIAKARQQKGDIQGAADAAARADDGP